MSEVEVVYIPLSGVPMRARLDYFPGMTVAAAILRSGLMESHPEIATSPVGIFAQLVTRDSMVKPGDRIELYRPLLLDPKEKRRQRARSLVPPFLNSH